MIKSNEEACTPAAAQAGPDGLLAATAPRVQADAGNGRKLLARLREILLRRGPQRAGVYLPLVRIDGND